MNTRHLITMANQIGQFFESMPDRDAAIDGIADHIKRFWEPRMRRALLATLDADASINAGSSGAEAAASTGAEADDAAALTPIARAAILKHRQALTPAAA